MNCTFLIAPISIGDRLYKYDDGILITYEVVGIVINKHEEIKVKLKYKDEYGDLSKLIISIDELSNFKLSDGNGVSKESVSHVHFYSATNTDRKTYEDSIIKRKKGRDK